MSILFAPLSFRLVRGTTWLESITFTEQATGLPVNLVDCEITMRVREEIEDEEVIIELSTADGTMTIVDAPNGRVDIRVEADDTLAFPTADHQKAVYVSDSIIDRAGPPAQREPGASGKVSVLPQVTRLP
jgi:hypothetical protein